MILINIKRKFKISNLINNALEIVFSSFMNQTLHKKKKISKIKKNHFKKTKSVHDYIKIIIRHSNCFVYYLILVMRGSLLLNLFHFVFCYLFSFFGK